MNISYNEFHVGKKIRDLCKFDGKLYASTGNVILANMKNVRLFADKLNKIFDERGQQEKRISAGSLNAMGLIDEVFHYVCAMYRKDAQTDAFTVVLAALDKEYGKEAVDNLLLEFSAEFPPVDVYQGKLSAKEYLAQTAIDTATGDRKSVV